MKKLLSTTLLPRYTGRVRVTIEVDKVTEQDIDNNEETIMTLEDILDNAIKDIEETILEVRYRKDKTN
jgi:hypothetical protein